MDFNSWNFTWSDKNISLNKVYSQKHWTYRSKLKKDWRSFFGKMLDEYDVPTIQEYKVHLRYRSRLDADNQIMLIKFFCDSLRDKGWVEDDRPKFFKGFSIVYDDNFSKTNTFKIKLDKLS